jgi:hypothetical protein
VARPYRANAIDYILKNVINSMHEGFEKKYDLYYPAMWKAQRCRLGMWFMKKLFAFGT